MRQFYPKRAQAVQIQDRSFLREILTMVLLITIPLYFITFSSLLGHGHINRGCIVTLGDCRHCNWARLRDTPGPRYSPSKQCSTFPVAFPSVRIRQKFSFSSYIIVNTNSVLYFTSSQQLYRINTHPPLSLFPSPSPPV